MGIKQKKKAVIIVSGGMDSVTLLHYAHTFMDFELHALSVDYGQRHKRELKCAISQCKELGVPHQVVNLKDVNKLLGGSALTAKDVNVPHEHYSHESQKLTIVPNRNMILLSIACGYAVSIGAKAVLYGAHTNDRAIYPDCRREFVASFDSAVKIATDNYDLDVMAPFIDKTKANIVKLGMVMNIDYTNTWTCYEGKDVACGVCGSCRERIEAFSINGVNDPLQYR